MSGIFAMMSANSSTAPAMKAAADPASVSGAAATAATVTIVTNQTICTPSGGNAPYSYSWAKLSDTGGTWSIGHATLAATQFVCAGVAAGFDYSANFRCTVTDANGTVVNSNTVSASVINYGSYA